MRYTYIPLLHQTQEFNWFAGSGMVEVPVSMFMLRSVDGTIDDLLGSSQYENVDLPGYKGPTASSSFVGGSGILAPKISETDNGRKKYNRLNGILNLYLNSEPSVRPYPVCDIYVAPYYNTAVASVDGPDEHHWVARIYASGSRSVYNFDIDIHNYYCGIFIKPTNEGVSVLSSGVFKSNLYTRGIYYDTVDMAS